ncbi:hypothetical protein HYO62_00425 [Aerococcaceae bacterium DSM 111022]|nr:hypothetical protein [Aerococcaceae bacterium DSM 111022]
MLSKQVDISISELESMTIGGLIDYAHEYADQMSKSKQGKKNDVRKATQKDIDRLL